MANDDAQHQKDPKAGKDVQHRSRESDADTLADVRLAPQRIGGKGSLTVPWGKRVERTEPKGQPCGAKTTSSHFRSQHPDNTALERTQIRDQPIRHCLDQV